MTKRPSGYLTGQVALQATSASSFSETQVKLLQAIDKGGSITSAAKQIGVSYKTAWDRIEAMNNISDRALVSRSAGGAKGGGTVLTELGKKVVEGFNVLQQEHEQFMKKLGNEVSSISDFANFSKISQLRTSARNQFGGTVSKITKGAVNTEVELTLGDSLSIVATITNDSQRQMKLKENDSAIALIKSSWILISTDTGIKTSARNSIQGQILRLNKGQVNSEVVLDIGSEKTLCAIITNTSVEELGLRKSLPVVALFKASSVILMAD